MFVRAIALSLALLFGGALIIPLATDTTEAGPRTAKKKKQKRYWRGVRKYSKRWWQLYRAQERRKRLRAKRKRSLRLRQLRLARQDAGERSNPLANARPQIASAGKDIKLVSGPTAPDAWRGATVSPTELQFRVDNPSGEQVGSAAISVVGPAHTGAFFPNGKSVGGISTSTLRRDVIDRMIRENGWVLNDYQKEIAGQQVYVVVGQSQARNGRLQQRMFYFTEVEGKIYSVATSSSEQEQERLAAESEKVITSLKSRVRPAVRASLVQE